MPGRAARNSARRGLVPPREALEPIHWAGSYGGGFTVANMTPGVQAAGFGGPGVQKANLLS